jgi:ferritin-like metal-binding protein YciE
MAEKQLDDLFLDTLKDIYYAERQILKALPKMAKAAMSPDLKAGFEQHLAETEVQVERLQQVFELLGKPARGKTCDAILGIIEEGKEIMDEYKGTQALDAGLVSAAQLGHKEVLALLLETLKEEEATDQKLTSLAKTAVNLKAAA